jgi:hypothetical protein
MEGEEEEEEEVKPAPKKKGGSFGKAGGAYNFDNLFK